MVLHEFGHFILAKFFGVKVEEFGLGYPPRLIGKKFGETLYSLNLLPFGAFVKIPGEIEKTEDKRSFSSQPVSKRTLIALGGVLSFWIISFLIFSFVPTGVAISYIQDNSPVFLAGLKVGDVMEKITVDSVDYSIFRINDAQRVINNSKGMEIIIDIQRGKEKLNIPVVPRISPPPGEGPLGVALGYGVAERNYPLYEAPFKGFLRTYDFTLEILTGWRTAISNAIKGKPTGVQMMGPIGIFSLFSEALKGGVKLFLLFLALISLYIAFFNILPIPSLDGGKILFLGIEAVRKKPVNPKIEQNITTTSFLFLIALSIWIAIKDISRLF